MNERLNFQDLVDLLAKEQGITKKNADLFLKELFLLITENLENLEPVKIKDFGTLKPILVNARKSINVNTGEEFEIAAHYKLSFTPDKTLREIVNKPFAHFESVILEEGVIFDNINTDLAELINEGDTDESYNIEVLNDDKESIISEINISDTQALSKEEKLIANDQIVDNNNNTEESRIENIGNNINNRETDIEVENTEKTIELDPSYSENVIATEIENKTLASNKQEKVQPILTAEDATIDLQPNNKKMNNNTKKAIVIAAILIIGGFGTWVYSGYFEKFMVNRGLWYKVISPPAHSEADSTLVNTPINNTEEKALATDSITLNAVIKEDNNKEVHSAETTVPKETVIAGTSEVKIKIEYGNTLRSLGLKYFGNKAFWVYIYLENKSIIKSPNDVPIGTAITVPASAKYGIDSKDAKSVKKAKQLEQELYKQFSL